MGSVGVGVGGLNPLFFLQIVFFFLYYPYPVLYGLFAPHEYKITDTAYTAEANGGHGLNSCLIISMGKCVRHSATN